MEQVQTKKLWFKAKRYGYGWYPVTWQGWGVLVVYLLALFATVTIAKTHIGTESEVFTSTSRSAYDTLDHRLYQKG